MLAASLVGGFGCEHVLAQDRSPHLTSIAFSPDGNQVLAGSQAGVVLHDADSGAVTGKLESELENVHDLRFSPSGDLLAVGGGIPGESGQVELFDWPSGDLKKRLETNADLVYRVAFTVDGAQCLSGAADEVCAVYDIESDRITKRYTDHSRDVLAVVTLPDGQAAVTASRDETLRVWDLRSGESVRTLHNHSRDVHALALQPSRGGLPLLASASADLTVRFWQPTIGRMVRFARLPAQPLDIAWFDHGNQLIAACSDGKARVIDPVTVQVVNTIDVSRQSLFAVDSHPTRDRQVAIAGTRGLMRLLEV